MSFRARRGFAVLAAFAGLALGTLAIPAGAVDNGDGADAEAALASLLAERALRGARVGVVVVDLATGAELAGRDAARTFVPASNQKILIAAAALAHWGPTHRFETPLFTDGGISAEGVLEGTLYVVGQGDPSLVSEQMWRLAEEVRLRGVSEVRGGLAIDASFFDTALFHPDWEPVSARSYHAPVSAFAANYSSFRIDVTPASEPGKPAALRVAPAVPYFRLAPEVTTRAGGSKLDVVIAPLPDGSGELVRVSGAISPEDPPRTLWRSVRYPELYAASLLRSLLEAQGVRVLGPTRLARVPAGARELLRFEGKPLSEIVMSLNKWSNNFVAEQLTKSLGAEVFGPPGSWERGARALESYLVSLGGAAGVVVADGSGLSPRNRISPAVLVRVLRDSAHRFDYGPEFLASLSVAGRDGTLEDRLEGDAQVRGKTGHLNHVASLCGVVSDATGRLLAFAVLVNGARASSLDVDAAIDAFVQRLARNPASEPPAAPVPREPA